MAAPNQSAPIIVEQLNASQWHVCFPEGRTSGVTNWVDAVSYAILCGTCDGNPVESVDLDYERLRLAQAGPRLVVRR